MTEERLVIKIQTLTPVWTGGVEGNCDRFHETGILGSLRWWYETIVRGLGYACYPTSKEKCELSGKETSEERIDKMCPACYLFGCGGWKRQFQLHVRGASTTPLHFRSSTKTNENWLQKIFAGNLQKIDDLNVFYGTINLEFLLTGNDTTFVRSQLIMLFSFMSKYGALGAKIQHGFGQILILEPSQEAKHDTIKGGLNILSKRIHAGEFCQEVTPADGPYDLRNFVCLDYDLPEDPLKIFINRKSHLGNSSKLSERKYVPCSFDLRYRGEGNFGMRNWLKATKRREGWNHDHVNKLMGTSPRGGDTLSEEDRTSSCVSFGMPYKLDDGDYRLRIFGFAPPDILKPEELKDLFEEYMYYAIGNGCNPKCATFGKEILEQVGGDRR